jgi:outer membrane lipoprotein-sorting protein
MKALAVATGVVLLSWHAQAESLADVLARMDRAAQDFHSLSASMKRLHFTAVLSESDTTEGVVRLKRVKNGKEGTTGVVEFQKPEPRTIFIKGKTAEIFYPKANTLEIYDTSKYTSNIDQILLLGFGVSSGDLRSSYDIKDGGAQKIGTANATRIELNPKSAELKKVTTGIEMWIPEGESNPIRIKFNASKDYDLVDYSDIKVNPALPDSAFELKTPPNVKKIYPQK